MMWSLNLPESLFDHYLLSFRCSYCCYLWGTFAEGHGSIVESVVIWSLSDLNRQWLDNLLWFPGDILERNGDLHEFGWKLLLVMKLSWQVLSWQSRLALSCCREVCLLLTRNFLQGQGRTLKTKPLPSCLHFLLVKWLHSELFAVYDDVLFS